MEEDLIKQMRQVLEDYLNKSGGKYMLNPDKAVVEAILKGLAKRKARYGEFYCPCRVVSGDLEKDKNIVCPCIYHEQEIAEKGICHCKLIVKKKE